jgi:Txe/YoeB family toxin of Txe-Axe toxin-antitoxin module
MRVIWPSSAWDEFNDWISDDFETAKIIVGLVAYVRSSSSDRKSVGKPLIRDLAGWLALEIVDSHRFVYRLRVRDNAQCLEILSCSGHYTKDRTF